jgi:carboxypeptidase family protein
LTENTAGLPRRRGRMWWLPAGCAGVMLGLLAAATALSLTGRWHHTGYGWRWPAGIGAAALLTAILLLAAALLRERGRDRGTGTPVASMMDSPAVVGPDAPELPEWVGAGSTWGGELTRPPAPPEPAPEPPAGPPVRGYVRDAAGNGIAEATATLIDATGTQVARCRTGTDGWYQLAVPAAGTYTLITRARGHQPKASLVTMVADAVELDLVLAGTAVLTGTVRLADSERGVAGATVALVTASGEVCDAVVTTDTGRYRFDELAAGSYTVVVHATGFQPTALPVNVPADATCNPVLTGAASLAGTARAARDNRPLPDTLVTLLDTTGRPTAELTTGPDGTYRFDNLAGGDYTVVATGYPATTAHLHLDPGDAHNHDLTLSHGSPRARRGGGASTGQPT